MRKLLLILSLALTQFVGAQSFEFECSDYINVNADFAQEEIFGEINTEYLNYRHEGDEELENEVNPNLPSITNFEGYAYIIPEGVTNAIIIPRILSGNTWYAVFVINYKNRVYNRYTYESSDIQVAINEALFYNN